MTNVGVFIDVANLYHKVRKAFDGRKLNFKAYLDYVRTLGTPVRQVAYCMQQDGEATGFIRYLRSLDFEVKHKRAKTITIGDRTIKQCNWGVAMSVDVLRDIDQYDTVVLGVSDQDTIPLVKYLKTLGKKVLILASCVPPSLRSLTSTREITEKELQCT